MNKKLFFVYALLFVGIFQLVKAQINIKVKVNNVSVSSVVDCDAGGANNSDFVFEYKVQDNSPFAFSNNTPVAGSIGMCNYVVINEQNGPYTLSPSSPGAAVFSPTSGVFFDRSYNCVNQIPTTFTLTWSAYENDDVSAPSITPVANGVITPQIITYTVPAANGTFTAQYTQTSLDGACPQTYIIEFEVEKTVGSFSPLAINFLDGNIICTGTSNGDLEASFIGGSGTVLSDWSVDGLGDYNDNTNLSGVSAGTYTIVVKDALNCTDTGVVVINEVDPPANITSFIAGSATVCAGQTGVAYAVATQTNATFFWSYSGGNATINGNGNNIDIDFGSTATTGTLSVYAQNSCSITPALTITISALASPNVLISGNNNMCANTQEVLTATGASTYSWSTGAVTASVIVSPSVTSIYTVTGTNASGCMAMKEFTMNVSASPTVQITGSTLAVCPSQTVALTAIGNGNLFIWSDGYIGANHTVSASATTIYTVTNTFTNSCYTQVTYTLNVTPVNLTVSGNTIVCSGNSTTLTASGANTYTWSGGGNSNINTLTPNASTTLTLNGTTSNGCSSSLLISINVVNVPTVTISGGDTICEGKFVNLIATSSGSVSYGWNSGANTASISVSPVGTFTYIVTVDNGGCSATASHEVFVKLIPAIDFSITGSPLCTTDGVYTFTSNPSGGLYTGVGVTVDTFDPSVGVGIYPITYEVTTSNGCLASETQTIEVMLCTEITETENRVLNVFPNPAKDFINVQSSKEIKSILVYDYSGKLVKMIETTSFETTIDISGFAKGFYSLMIITNDFSQTTMKVVKD